MKTALIHAVRVIVTSKVKKPIIVLEVTGGNIVRSPKQLFTDLQNSGRLLSLPNTALDRGIEALSPDVRETFLDECYSLAGKQVTGDWRFYKAGEDYVVTGNHPALKDPNHEMFNKIKDGETLKAKDDGCWVEGFLSIPKTDVEKTMDKMAKQGAQMLANMFAGFAGAAAFGQLQALPASEKDAFDDEPSTEALIAEEVTGNAKPQGKK